MAIVVLSESTSPPEHLKHCIMISSKYNEFASVLVETQFSANALIEVYTQSLAHISSTSKIIE